MLYVGLISGFEGTGPAFRPFVYEPGPSLGVDLWPGILNGGYVYGLPARGELFLLDGRCDATLPRTKILALVLRSLSRQEPSTGG